MHTTRGSELELSTKKLKIQKTSQRYLTLFQMPVVIWERWIAYGMCMGDTDFCIDHLQHTEAEVIVEDMGAFEEDGDLHLMMQMQPFRNDCIGAPPLDNRVLCSCIHSYLMVVMVVRH